MSEVLMGESQQHKSVKLCLCSNTDLLFKKTWHFSCHYHSCCFPSETQFCRL